MERVKKQEENTKRRRDAAEAGLDHERVEQLDWTAEECDKWEKKKKKKTPNVGFDGKLNILPYRGFFEYIDIDTIIKIN